MASYKARATAYVTFACIVAASAGLNFGYSVGISGEGLYRMDAFQSHFSFSSSCDTIPILVLTSSLYLTGLIACFPASFFCQSYGRRPSIMVGGLSFMAGAVLAGAAKNLPMLIVGRMLSGVGVGFGNQAVPIYLSEIAPPKQRGAFNIMFHLSTTLGIICASLVNFAVGTISSKWKWKLALGSAVLPAIVMTTGGFFLPETPSSLIQRGQYERGRRILTHIRGTQDIEEEYEVLKQASLQANSRKRSFRALLERRNRPQLCIAILFPFFQQMTGINVVVPFLSFASAMISGGASIFGTLIAIAFVDRCVGRRYFFLEGGVQMFLSQVAYAALIRRGSWSTIVWIFMLCVYNSAFSWSWGPLGWLVPSEVFPIETRSAGQAVTVSLNLLFSLVITQAYSKMLCSNIRTSDFEPNVQVFSFFAAWVFVMTLFVYWFVPETKGVSIEEMNKRVWSKHWFWKRYYSSDTSALELRRR